jgi:hypothetical protein
VPKDVRRVPTSVVGQELLGGDAKPLVVGDRSMKEGSASGTALVGQDLGVDDSRRVVDGDVDELPPRTVDRVAAVPGDSVTHAHDSSELLNVQMDEIAGAFSLVTDYGLSGRPSASEAFSLEYSRHCRARHLQLAGNCRSTRPTVAQKHDDTRALWIRQPRHPPWSGWAVAKISPSDLRSRQPLVSGPNADTRLLRCLGHGPAQTANPVDQKRSTHRGGSGSTVNVHPGFLLWEALVLATQDSLGRLRVNNPESVNNVFGHYI